MTTNVEYALMAGASYISTRSDVNKIAVLDCWVERKDKREANPSSGFEATYFTKGTEIVISFAGTDPSDKLGDIAADLALAAGIISDQLRQAADYYLAVKASAPAGATITFTGHSLGGGLASLMAVLFGESAYTFDQAPFRQSAQIFVDTDLNGNQTSRSVAQRLRDYLTGRTTDTSALAKLDAYIVANDPLSTTPPNPADTLAVRSGQVSNINVDGEFLTSWFLVPSSSRIGSQSNIENSHDNVGGIDLHSQALMAAFLQSEQTAVVVDGHKQSLSEVTFKLTDLLRMIYDKSLFAYPVDTENTKSPNFLELIVNHEAGHNPRTSAAITPDAMVTRFTRDLWKIAQDGGLTLNDGESVLSTGNASNTSVGKALTAFAMQMYYEDTANATDRNKELFSKITGGLQFDMADVAKTFKAAFDAREKLNLKDAKGYDYFAAYLYTCFAAEEEGLINTFLPTLRDWYVQAGNAGMNASDTRNNGAFMLGGAGADTLTGGTADDLLIGNAGNDKLDGGQGNDVLLGGVGDDDLKGNAGKDTLLGGTGNDTLDGGTENDNLQGGTGTDTYVFTGTYGTDLITDSDGQGSLKFGTQTLSGVTWLAENVYKDNTTGQIVVRMNGGTSLIALKEGDANRVLVKDWSETKNLGISLQGSAPAAPATTLAGDFKKATDGSNFVIDGSNNYVSAGEEAGALDLLTGTAGNDVIDGKAGDDALSGKGGDDTLIGGTGGDILQGGMGKDTLVGGEGDDLLYGSSDDPLVLPTKTDFTPPENSYTNPRGTGFNWTYGYNQNDFPNGVALGFHSAPRNRLADDQGNLIDGGAGNDFIAAGTGADIVHGGAGKDYIRGMDKDDILFGDSDNDVIYGDGDAGSDIDSVVWTTLDKHGSDLIDGGDGDDFLYGQGGSDILFGGKGDDIIWGDEDESLLPVANHGNDFLFGGDGSDQIYGGGGNDSLDGGDKGDILEGGAGNDTLIGGKGNDTLVGGAGKDIYFFNKGDGEDTIIDTSDKEKSAEASVLVLGKGFERKNIKFGRGSLLIDLGRADPADSNSPRDAIHFENFDAQNPDATPVLGEIRFADGGVMTYAEILAQGFDIDGTDGDDDGHDGAHRQLHGTGVADRIRGFAGNDVLAGFAGDDTLDGGAGADALFGGAGNDTYLIRAGESMPSGVQIEQIDDESGNDTIRFAAGIDRDSFRVYGETRSDGKALLMIDSGTADRLGIVNGGADAIERFEFVDGEVLDAAALVGRYAAAAVRTLGGEGRWRLYGGKEGDVLVAHGGDRVSGGRGDDAITLHGDGNTLLWQRGDGADTITANGQGNVLHVRGGLTAADLRWGAGGLVLQLGSNPGDSLRFDASLVGAGVLPFATIAFDDGSTLDFASLFTHGADQVGNDGNDRLAGTLLNDRMAGGAGDDVYVVNHAGDIVSESSDAGVDSVEAGIDYVLGEELENLALTGGAIVGTGNALDNRLTGNSADNRLLGGGGDDFLDGGLGNDVLEGGEGADSYRFAAGVGNDSVFDDGGRIVLDSSIDFRDVSVRRDGDDVVLDAGGGSLRVMGGHLSDSTAWSVLANDGSAKDFSALIADTARRNADAVEQRKNVYLDGVRSSITQRFSALGMGELGGGAWGKTVTTESRPWIQETKIVSTTFYEYRRASDQSLVNLTSQRTEQTAWTQSFPWVYQSDYAGTVSQIRMAGSDEVVVLQNGYQTSYSKDTLWADVRWESAYREYGSSSTTPGGVFALEQQQLLLTVSTRRDVVERSYVGAYTGHVGAVSPASPHSAVQVFAERTSYAYQLVTLELTDGDHVVYADEYSAVIAGEGDNLIQNAGFAYGGKGNSRLVGGKMLVAGEGDQWLEGGETMVVGDGRNTVVAGSGAVVEVSASNIGPDLLIARGSDWSAGTIMDAVYRAQGRFDWQLAYCYPDMYRVAINDARNYHGIYVTADEAVAGFGWPVTTEYALRVGWVQKIEPLSFILDVAGSALVPSDFYAASGTPVTKILATDFEALNTYRDILPKSPTVRFGEGITREGLLLSWGEVVSPLDGQAHVTLDVSWGSERGVKILMPHTEGQIGAVANDFRFANGTRMTLAELVAMAPPAPDFDAHFYHFDPEAGSAELNFGNLRGVRLGGEGVSGAAYVFSRDGQDLVVWNTLHAAQLRLRSAFDEQNSALLELIKLPDGNYWGGAEIVNGTAAGDLLNGSGRGDQLEGGAGHDYLFGLEGNDYLAGGDGDDYLSGDAGHDVLLGGAGLDRLNGGAGNDLLHAGPGGGTLYGGAGNDLYLFGRGDGEVHIDQRIAVTDPLYAGVDDIDVIRFGEGITAADVVIGYDGSSATLSLSLRDSSDVLHIFAWRPSWDAGYARQIARFEFADGTVWTDDTIPMPPIIGGDENDVLSGTTGRDVMRGGAGDDFLHAFDGDDTVYGDDGDDYLSGYAGDDVLLGGAGRDRLNGGAGNDTLHAGAGGGELRGGEGDDIYRFERGDGLVRIFQFYAQPYTDEEGNPLPLIPTGEDARITDVDVVRFGESIQPGDVALFWDSSSQSLQLRISESDDVLHIVDWLGEGSHPIARFEFADGTVWTRDNMPTLSIVGSEGEDWIYGSRGRDEIAGGLGNDYLFADAGDDLVSGGGGSDYLAGGPGNDILRGDDGDDRLAGEHGDDTLTAGGGGGTLLGGAGNDTYLFNLGDGAVSVEQWIHVPEEPVEGEEAPPLDESGYYARADDTDIVRFGEGILPASLRVSLSAWGDLTIRVAGTDDTLQLAGWRSIEHRQIARFEFADGSVWLPADIDAMTGNHAPVTGSVITDQQATEGEAFFVTLPADAFVDADVGDILSLSASVEDGVAWPAWLHFDGRAFSGTPGTGDVGALRFRLTATDHAGETVSQQFSLNIGAAAGLTLIGTTGNDTLTGTHRNDTLDGGVGRDRMVGGAGNDTYYVENAGDRVVEYVAEGTDTVISTVTLALAANVENLTLAGIGNISGTGNGLDNVLTGNAGNNALNGGLGVDAMMGGVGNDTYYVENLGDVVSEFANEGTDRVISTISYTLGDNVENLTLTGSEAINGTGNELNNAVVGNAAENVLAGLGGNDSLTGGDSNDTLLGGTGNDTLNGGLGADNMVGGADNDTYYVDNLGDVVSEFANEGTDRIISTISYTLGDNVENLTLLGAEAINGTGNALDNTLVGNAGANRLYGLGGNDRLTGNASDDLLDGGDGNDILTAGDGNDILMGGVGNDTLNGGAGDDSMTGDAGNDTYYVDSAGDSVTELADEGTDRVISTISYTLGDNLENLTLSGTEAINGIGNALANSLAGNAAANLLNGGEGNDTLNGAAGIDFLEGMAGNDTLSDTAGSGYFNGGAGADRLTGGASADFFLGDVGNDTITSGDGDDIIVFNKGDGQDTFAAGGAGSDTLSLGGGIDYVDLAFRKSSNDLVLKTGTTDQITFKNWYATTPSKPVLNLQVIAEAMADFAAGGADPLRDQKVENFNFAGLAGAFDAARTANPGLTTWALTNALASFQLAGSDSAALGGDLAYQYGKNGTLTGIGLNAAQQVIGDTNFGNSAQTLRPLSGLQEGAVRLS